MLKKKDITIKIINSEELTKINLLNIKKFTHKINYIKNITYYYNFFLL